VYVLIELSQLEKGGSAMPMSEEAAAGLRAAVEHNPDAARGFTHILRDLPIGVRYKKQDRYGPLSLMIFGAQMKWITRNIGFPGKTVPFPEEKLKACETFNREWLERRFSKQELAEAIERILAEIPPSRPMLEQVGPNATLVITATGKTLLFEGGGEPGSAREI
jgi:hypothetical protein